MREEWIGTDKTLVFECGVMPRCVSTLTDLLHLSSNLHAHLNPPPCISPPHTPFLLLSAGTKSLLPSRSRISFLARGYPGQSALSSSMRTSQQTTSTAAESRRSMSMPPTKSSPPSIPSLLSSHATFLSSSDVSRTCACSCALRFHSTNLPLASSSPLQYYNSSTNSRRYLLDWSYCHC